MPTVVPDHFDHVMKETCRRRKKCITILLHLNALFEWLEARFPSFYKSKCGEFIEDFEPNFPTNSLLANLTRIISREFNSVILMTVGGAYDSAARTLRWMLETVLKAFVAIDDKSILTGNAQDRGQAMTLDDFVDFLVYTDSRAQRRKERPLANWINSNGVGGHTIKFRKIQGIDRLPDSINDTWLAGLGDDQRKHADLIYFAYEQLSSYIHTSLRHFRLSSLCLHPFVFYDRKEFDEIYRLILLTSDVISYLLILGIWMDIGFYSPEKGAKFAEVIVEEMEEGKEEHAYFFEELPSLKRLVSLNENGFRPNRSG